MRSFPCDGSIISLPKKSQRCGSPDGYTLSLQAGSAYSGLEHSNTFHLIKIEREQLRYRHYQTEPGCPSWSPQGEWQSVLLPWAIQQTSVPTESHKVDLSHVGEKAADSAKLCKRQIEESISRITAHLDRFEYSLAIEVADTLAQFVEAHESLIPGALLAEVYVQLGEVEVVRVNWEHATLGRPKDFTKAVYFAKKAKHVGSK